MKVLEKKIMKNRKILLIYLHEFKLDHKATVRELAIEFGVSHVTAVSHLKEISKRKKVN